MAAQAAAHGRDLQLVVTHYCYWQGEHSDHSQAHRGARRRGTPRATGSLAGAVTSELNDVSCTSASACIAVGNTPKGATGARPMAERWNGIAWTILSVKDIPGAGPSGASCSPPDGQRQQLRRPRVVAMAAQLVHLAGGVHGTV